jgi:hypothetical protein
MRSAGGDDQRQANLTDTRRVKRKMFLKMMAKEAFGIDGQSKIVEHEKLIPGLRLAQVFGDFDISESNIRISIILRLEN